MPGKLSSFLFPVLFLLLLLAPRGEAHGRYGNKEGLGCSACHTQGYGLNDFGREYQRNGHTIPSNSGSGSSGGSSGSGTTPPPDLSGGASGGGGDGGQSAPPRSDLPPPDQPMPQGSPQTGDEVNIPVGGTGATPENISMVAEAMRKGGYCPRHLQGMRTIQIVHVPGRQSVQGSWEGGKILFYAQTGRAKPVYDHTVVHEFAHHFTLAAEPGFGQELLRTAGNADSSYPTDYAFTIPEEQIAELLTYYLLGDESEVGWRPQFRPREESRALVAAAFGCSGKIVVRYPDGTTDEGSGTPAASPTPPEGG